MSWIDPYGLCQCVADTNIQKKDHSSKDVSVPYLYFFQRDGSKHTVTCTYRCTGDNGKEEIVPATHNETYSYPQSKDRGNEGTCEGRTFKWETNFQTNKPMATPIGFEKFDPSKAKSKALKDWAKKSCGNC